MRHLLGHHLREVQVTGNLYFGLACLGTGDYRRAEDPLLKVLQLLEGDRSRERFGLAGFPAVMARGYSTWTMYRGMEMNHWVAEAEAELAQAQTTGLCG